MSNDSNFTRSLVKYSFPECTVNIRARHSYTIYFTTFPNITITIQSFFGQEKKLTKHNYFTGDNKVMSLVLPVSGNSIHTRKNKLAQIQGEQIAEKKYFFNNPYFPTSLVPIHTPVIFNSDYL